MQLQGHRIVNLKWAEGICHLYEHIVEVVEQQYTDTELDRNIFDFISIVQGDAADSYSIVGGSEKFYITESGTILIKIIRYSTQILFLSRTVTDMLLLL